MQIGSLGVYCGSNSGLLPEYRHAAADFGARLARENVTLVYGGGNVGLMGALADGCLEAGGKVIGVIPKVLVAKEVAHKGLTELRVVGSMHERKRLMVDLSDGFVALPGGIGTLDEIFEVLTWSQLGLHSKPCAFLNVAGYYDSLVGFLGHMTGQRFIKPEHRDALLVETDAGVLMDRIRAYAPVKAQKWIDRRTA